MSLEEFRVKGEAMLIGITAQSKEYLRRQYETITTHAWENGIGIHLIVICDAEYPGLNYPPDHVHGGVLRINVGVNSMKHYTADEEGIKFSARFDGVVHFLSIPYFRMAHILLQIQEGWLQLDMGIPTPQLGQIIPVPTLIAGSQRRSQINLVQH